MPRGEPGWGPLCASEQDPGGDDQAPPSATWSRLVRSDTDRNRLRIREIVISSMATTIPATTSAVWTDEIRNGREVEHPADGGHGARHDTARQRRPRPVSVPSSDSASEKPMLIPAPTAVARPTNSADGSPTAERRRRSVPAWRASLYENLLITHRTRRRRPGATDIDVLDYLIELSARPRPA